MAGKGSAGRVPPHNIDAEASLLGAALLSPVALPELTRLRPGDFYHPGHGVLAGAIIRLAAAGTPVDIITVGEDIRRHGETELVESVDIPGLLDAVPSVSAAPHYAAIIRDAATLRGVITAAAQLTDVAYDGIDDVTGAIAAAGELIASRLAVTAGTGATNLAEYNIDDLLDGNYRTEEPTLLTRTDGHALIYPGMIHALQGEPTAGKTWIALTAAKEIIEMGGAVVALDYEDTGPGFIRRLRTLGMTNDQIRAGFRYLQPVGMMGPAERVRLAAIIDETNPDLVIIDSVGRALANDGLSEDDAQEYLTWLERIPRPITRTGAAVLLLDHVVKDKETRGRWARGTSAKVDSLDGAGYYAENVLPFSKERAGWTKLVISKDRHGGVGAQKEIAAEIHYTPHAAGERLVVEVRPHEAATSPGDTWKPTHIMAALSKSIAESSTPLTATALKALHSNYQAKMVANAVARLTSEGYIALGKRRTLVHVRPYIDPDPGTTTGRHLEAVPPPTDDDYPDAHLFDPPPPPEEP